ncbi:MAG: hypothetical protein KME29_34515 [Calothrix sp. FI2-JRJ7]|nr:hypothetical protein [Calothrix sp. FI2-JRJ7]
MAVKVRKQLQDKSLSEIAAQLEKCLSVLEEEDRIFAVKDLLLGCVSNRESLRNISDDSHIDFLELAEDLAKKSK